MAKMATKIQKGDVVDYTATTVVANGDVVVLGDRIGVAQGNAEIGETIALEIVGVYEIAADTADAIAYGDVVYFDDATKEVTTDSATGANTKAGIAITEKSATTAGTVSVKIG